MDIDDIVQVASCDIIEVQPEIKLEDLKELLELSQNTPLEPVKESHSEITNTVYIKESSSENLGSSEAVEIKPEDIVGSDPENSNEQLQIIDSETFCKPSDDEVAVRGNNQTKEEFQYICNTNEELQGFNICENIEEQSKPDKTEINSTPIQSVCIDLTEESNHESVSIPHQTSNKWFKAYHGGQIAQAFHLLKGDCNKEKGTNEMTKKPVMAKKHVRFLMANGGKENDKKVSVNEKKYFLDTQVHEDEYIMRPVGFACAYCSYYSTLLSHIKHHIKFKHRDQGAILKKKKRHLCPYCHKRFILIDEHISSYHSKFKDVEWVQCHQCEFKTKTKYLLQCHIKARHTVKEDCEVVCKECGLSFTGRYNLNAHKRRKHSVKPFDCRFCDFTTGNYSIFRTHKRVHREAFKCARCAFQGQDINEVIRHKAKEHPNWQQCHLCPYRGKTPQQLQLHLIHHQEKKRDEDMTYRCTKCDYKTYRANNLKIHMLNHKKPDEIEMFHCYHCDFKAKRKDNLKTHIFKHDIYKSILTCFICSFETRSQFELTKHLDFHSKNQEKEKVAPNIIVRKLGMLDGSKDSKDKKDKNKLVENSKN